MSDDESTKENTHWWFPVWAGLIIDTQATHWHKMGKAIWLYLYILARAKRETGDFKRSYKVISKEMGIPDSTIRSWITILKNKGYISTQSTGRAQLIHIQQFKLFPKEKPKEKGAKNLS